MFIAQRNVAGSFAVNSKVGVVSFDTAAGALVIVVTGGPGMLSMRNWWYAISLALPAASYAMT